MLIAAMNSSDATAPVIKPAESGEQLGQALGRLASGVYIVTAGAGAARIGLLATWIAQAAFEPPLITVAINKQRPIHQSLLPDTSFTINVLSNKNMDIFKAFAKPAQGSDDDRFAGLELKNNESGGPAFAAAVAYLNCRVCQLIDSGDHVVVLAEVIAGEVLHPEAEPMTHLRKSGFQY